MSTNTLQHALEALVQHTSELERYALASPLYYVQVAKEQLMTVHALASVAYQLATKEGGSHGDQKETKP